MLSPSPIHIHTYTVACQEDRLVNHPLFTTNQTFIDHLSQFERHFDSKVTQRILLLFVSIVPLFGGSTADRDTAGKPQCQLRQPDVKALVWNFMSKQPRKWYASGTTTLVHHAFTSEFESWLASRLDTEPWALPSLQTILRAMPFSTDIPG